MNPLVSIIIPTRNSEKFITVCLNSIFKQNYPSNKFEAIVVDNASTDRTSEIAKKMKARVFQVKGLPPQVCRQRNLGAQKARFEYIYVLDHDMELVDGFLANFAAMVTKTKNSIDAWYVPETIIASSPWLSQIRTFENSFYNETWIGAVRIIKKEKFNLTPDKYDLQFSGGPADWDMDIQLRKLACVFGTMEKGVYHHEEGLPYLRYVTKKGGYVKAGELYKEKWKKRDEKMYQEILHTQYSPYYRLLGVFLEKDSWKKLLSNFHLYLGFLFTKTLMAVVYYMNLRGSSNEK